jgi:hypothetical protein
VVGWTVQRIPNFHFLHFGHLRITKCENKHPQSPTSCPGSKRGCAEQSKAS